MEQKEIELVQPIDEIKARYASFLEMCGITPKEMNATTMHGIQLLAYIADKRVLRAKFVVVKQTHEYTYIADVGKTATSVTNNVEAIVKFLSGNHILGSRRLFYRDSDGQIDEIIHDNGAFIRFAPGHEGIENLPELAAYPDDFMNVEVN
jgi:hypothetical protein